MTPAPALEYRQLFQHMLNGLAYCRIVLDERGRAEDFVILDVNDAFFGLTGLKDVVGERASAIIPGIRELEPDLLERCARVATTGRAETFEIDFRPLERWFSVALYCPRPEHFVAAFDNITDRKRTTAQLAREKERLAVTLTSIGDAVIATDSAARVTLMNPVAESLTGWKAHEAVGRNLEEVFRIVSEGTQQSVESPAIRVLRDGAVVGLANHTLLVARDGTQHPIADSGAPIRDAHGLVAGVVLVFRDQGEERANERALRSSERRYRDLVELAPDAVLVNRNNEIELVNRAAMELFGAQAAEDLLGKTPFDLFHPDFHPFVRERVALLLRGSKAPPARNRIVRLDGTTREVEVTGAPFWDERGIAIQVVLHDLTEQMRSEQERREAEGRFRTYFEAAPEALFVVDGEGRFVDSNPAALALLNADLATLRSITLSDLVGVGDRARLVRDFASLVATGTLESDYPIVTRDGRSLWVALRGVRLGDDRFIAFCSDITARRDAERLVEDRERHLRTILETALDGFWVIDEHGRLVDVNEAACAISGYGRDEMLRLSVADLEAVETSAEIHAHIARIKRDGSDRFESRHRCKDGRLVDIEMSVGWTELDEPRIVCFIRDITASKAAREALRQSEGRSRALLENSSDMTLVVDADGCYRFWSQSAAAGLGWSAEEKLGRYALEMIHDDDRPRIAAILAHLLTIPGEVAHDRLRYRHKNGSWRELDVTGRNLLNDPAVRGIVVNSRDVTDQRLLEQQLVQAQKLESIGTLAGGVAHDFNNLLTVILSCADALREDVDGGLPASLSDIEEIQAAGTRASDLTRQLLAFARRQVIVPVPLDLSAVVRGSEKLLRRVLGEDVELVVRSSSHPWLALCDPGQIEQVVLNLAVNARDAMPRGGELHIETENVLRGSGSLHPDVPEGDHVLLRVRDSGCGMSEEVKAHLFEPFFTTKPVGRGTGLGLATVYGIVKQSGGHVRVESAPGHGTTFEIFFPRTLEAQASTAAPKATSLRGTESILFVEDDRHVREITVRALRGAGYELITAPNAQAALDLPASRLEHLDLVITDVVMPGLDGRSLADELRRRHPRLRVLFVSGYTRDAIAERGVVDSGIDFLAKPFTGASLLARVRAILDAK